MDNDERNKVFFFGQRALKMHYVKVFKNVGIENKKYSKFKLLTID